MKFVFLFLLFSFVTVVALHAQTDPYDPGDKVFTVVEEPADFPGGTTKLNEYIAANLQVPEKVLVNGVEGKVFVSFITEKDGTLTTPEIVKGLCPDCDAAVLELVKKMPAFRPAKQNGRPVRYKFVLPVQFRKPVLRLPAIGVPPGQALPGKAESTTYPLVQPPAFPGGQEAITQIISGNIKTPAGVGTERPGPVYVKFVVGTDGKASRHKVENYLFGPAVTEEAIRVTNLLQGWQPAQYKGNPIGHEVMLTLWFPYSR